MGDEDPVPNDEFNINQNPQGPTGIIPDFAIANRLIDDRVDMGAFEFQGEGCPWDLNNDGIVDGADLGQLLAAWGDCADCEDCPADFNGDCVVNGADLGQLLANWGTCPAVSYPVPCP